MREPISLKLTGAATRQPCYDAVNCRRLLLQVALRLRLIPMPSERESLVRDINGLKESIRLAWMDMIAKPMTAAERAELRDSINSLVTDLDALRSKLDRLPKTRA